MARTLIHSFLYGPNPPTWPAQVRVYVYLNDDEFITAEAITVDDGPYQPVPMVVLEEELNFDPDSVYMFYCEGSTLVRIHAKLEAPFGYIERIPNSGACIPRPCPIITNLVTPTNETVLGAHDGGITAIIEFGDPTDTNPVEYSLDNINWQTSGVFIGLHPGNYQLRARQGENCRYSVWVTVGEGVAVSPDPPFPWQDKFCSWFKLIRDEVEYDISEPIKWDQVNIVGKRDKEWHGWLYQYSDGIIELEWDCPAGMEVIMAEYEAKGNDGLVYFKYGYSYKGTDYTLLDSKVNLNTYKVFPGKVSASIERSDMNQLFTSRTDTKVKMNQSLSVGDVAVIPPAPIETTLHAKEIVRDFTHKKADPIEGYFDFKILDDQPQWLIPDTNMATLSEISEFYGKDFTQTELKPDTVDNYTWLLQFDGIYNFIASFNIRGNVSVFYIDTLNLRFSLILNINGIEHLIGLPQETIITTREDFTISLGGSELDMELKKGDKVYFYIALTTTETNSLAGNIRGSLFQEFTDISFNALEQSSSSTANGWFIGDAMDQCIKVITDNSSELKSKFFSRIGYQWPSDGQGALNLLTNGKQIRKFNVAQNPLTISLKEILASAKSIYCIGFGFEKVGLKEVVRVERVGYFYQNKQILVIEECFDYREETAKELLYNEIEIGYDKYQDSGYNTNDEFNTKQERVGPIKTNKEKLTQKSTLITSGYKIEDVRRQQFMQTGKDSYSNDDDGFMISMRRVDGVNFLPEKDEAFAFVENLISPGTVYNLRLTPTRMLLNWAEWLRNAFHYKQPTDKIKSTFVAQNGKLKTQLAFGDIQPVGDINLLEWTEGADILISDYAVAERIYRPEWVFFKCRITPDTANTINAALMGRATDVINYGYLTVKDHKGDYQAGFPYEMEYNFVSEQLSVKMLKKWDSPVDPNAECCRPLHVNGCKLKINGNDLILK